MSKFLFFVLLSSFYFLGAQDYSPAKVDSLVKNAEQNPDMDSCIFLVKKLYKISDKIDYKVGKINCLNSLAFSYYLKGENETSIKYALLQEKMAREAKEYLLICSALRTKAASYSRLGLIDESIKALSEALMIADKIPETDKKHQTKGAVYQAKQIFYNENSVPDSALFFHKEALREFLKIKAFDLRSKLMGNAYNNLGIAYIDIKKYDSGDYYLTKALAIGNKTNDQYKIYKACCNLGRLYHLKGEHQKAIDYYIKSLYLTKKSKDVYTTRYNLSGLQVCYGEINDSENSKKYLIDYTKLNDSLTTAEKASLKLPLKEIAEKKEGIFNKTRAKLYGIIALAVLLMIASLYFVFVFFRNYQKEKREKFSKEETILEKDSKLTQLESKINDAFEEVLELAKADDPAFLARFKEVYPEFYDKLTSTYPDLTISQLRFCAMLRLNFSTKEIAHYHHTTVRGIQTKKTRLRKQLNLTSEEDLNKWMMNLK